MIFEIHQFHLHFSHGVLLLCSLEFCPVDTAYRVWVAFHMLLGRTFVFGLHTKNLIPKNLTKSLKTPKEIFLKT